MTTMTHTEYGVLVTTDAGHTYLNSTFRIEATAVEQAANLLASDERLRARHVVSPRVDIVTLAQRQVTYTLGEWESLA